VLGNPARKAATVAVPLTDRLSKRSAILAIVAANLVLWLAVVLLVSRFV
jgi:hypothetical protein